MSQFFKNLTNTLIVAFLASSCSTSSKKQSDEIKQMEKSLANSSRLIGYSTKSLLEELEKKNY